MMPKHRKDKKFSSRLRTFLVEYLLVFLIIAINGTYLILLHTTLVQRNATPSQMSVYCLLGIMFGCFISTTLVYFVRGRLYYNRIKTVCDIVAKVADGDLNARIPLKNIPPKDEMDYLIYNFNKMMVEISSLENMRNDFIADVSHEIKTPLSVIQGYADLLSDPKIDSQTRKEYTALLSDSIMSLTDLATNILKLNKIENQGITKKEKFFLDEQIRGCILAVENSFQEKEIEIFADLEECEINTDKALSEIIWNNLLSNALKYTESGGRLEVRLQKDGEKVFISFKDNGCGMDEKTLSSCFDKFFQGDSSHAQRGNGLGLAIVKQIITVLEAQILVESTLGEGSIFKVIF